MSKEVNAHKCNACDGTGDHRVQKGYKCPLCRGFGQRLYSHNSVPCAKCEGVGQLIYVVKSKKYVRFMSVDNFLMQNVRDCDLCKSLGYIFLSKLVKATSRELAYEHVLKGLKHYQDDDKITNPAKVTKARLVEYFFKFHCLKVSIKTMDRVLSDRGIKFKDLKKQQYKNWE